MQITLQAILNNLISLQSDDIMEQHLADERLSSVWSGFMVCRFLSFSNLGVGSLPALDQIANIRDPKVAYPMLMAICKDIKHGGKLNRPSSYKQSPFTE